MRWSCGLEDIAVIALLVYLLVILLVFSVVWWAIGQMSLPQPVRVVAVVVMALIAVVVLLNLVPLGGVHLGRLG